MIDLIKNLRFASWYCFLIGIALIQLPSISIAEVLSLDDGSSYEGQVANGVPDGYGTISYSNGDEYVGEFQNGSIDGRGAMSYANGEQYVGEWKDNQITGRGTFNYANGEKYVGEFKAGERNGRGTFTYADGTTEVGEWQDDQKLEDVTSTDVNKELDLEYWKGIKDSEKMSAYEDYIREFPNGKFYSIATARIEKLRDGIPIGELAKLNQFSGIYRFHQREFCNVCDMGKLKLDMSGDKLKGVWDIYFESNNRVAMWIDETIRIGEKSVDFTFKKIGAYQHRLLPRRLDASVQFLDDGNMIMTIRSKIHAGDSAKREYTFHGKKSR